MNLSEEIQFMNRNESAYRFCNMTDFLVSVGLYLFDRKICHFSQPTEHKLLSAKYVEC